jgi:hypothetical protein
MARGASLQPVLPPVNITCDSATMMDRDTTTRTGARTPGVVEDST